jgi:hypothetical protein
MSERKFVLIIVDRDTGEFTIEGPMTDDRAWNKAVVNAQAEGRNIRCFGMGDLLPDAAAAEWQALSSGAKRIAAGSIVTPQNVEEATWASRSEGYRLRLASRI